MPDQLHVMLCLFYTLWGIFPFLFEVNVLAFRLMLLSLWMGFVLAISFMEAWLKFRAPFVEKYAAIDIGRCIFPALNAVESGLCLSQWILYARRRDISGVALYYMVALTLILVIEILILTPGLAARGEYVISRDVSNDVKLNDHQERLLKKLRNELRHKKLPSVRYHVSYIGFELLKIIISLALSLDLLLKLSLTGTVL